jgi:hypothetical protein
MAAAIAAARFQQRPPLSPPPASASCMNNGRFLSHPSLYVMAAASAAARNL